MDVETDNGNIKLKFDDWMWMMNDQTVVNRSYMKKLDYSGRTYHFLHKVEA